MKTQLQKFLKTCFLTGIVFSLSIVTIYAYLETDTVMASSSASDNVIVTLNVVSGITISDSADITMSNSIGVSADTAVGTSTWTVRTNNITGYSLTVQSSTSPAMQSGSNTINDYHLGTPDTFAATSGSAYFGFSAFGTDVPTGTWGTGSTCTGAGNTAVATLKYLGFATTTQQIATRSATTTYAGSASTVCFVAQQNNYFIPSGVYTATITATAVTL